MEAGRTRHNESRDGEHVRWTNGERKSPSRIPDASNDVSQDFLKPNATPTLTQCFAQNFKGLVKINLSKKGLTVLEVSFEESKNLEELIVDGNRLKTLPKNMRELTSLKLLSAAENKLATLPEDFGELSRLEVLRLSGNNISELSDSCLKLERLRILDLSNNALRVIPGCLTHGLPLLEELDLSHNRINNLSSPSCSKMLRKLHLGHNPKNDEFPGWLLTEKFPNLEEIVLDKTCFSTFDIPAEGPLLRNLKKLSMANCGLSDIIFEQICCRMVDLEIVRVSNGLLNRDGNMFWTMPTSGFVNPDKVEEIYIQAVGLPALPKEINQFGNLAKLDISKNSISSMPEEICELEKLEFLNAAHNDLYALPQSIGKLTALKVLFLESNKLSSLPESTQHLASLEFIDLYNNEFFQLPTQLNTLQNLKALDIEGNIFTTENLQIGNIEYIEARNHLRSTSNMFLLRSNDSKVFSESDDMSYSSSELVNYSISDVASPEDTNLNDVEIQENWDMSDDSADEYDPTVQPLTYGVFSTLRVSPVFYYGNFCPADLHSARVKDQLATARKNGFKDEPPIEAGQFDDA